MLGITDIFNGSNEFLTEEIILPVGLVNSGTYSLPAGRSWTDYEYVEIIGGHVSASERAYGYTQLNKEVVAAFPTSLITRVYIPDPTTLIYAEVTFASANTFTISATSVGCIKSIKGYLKKYGTRNISKTVNVNGGSNCTANSRYEIDIETELGSDYLNRDLIVIAEVYNNSGTGTAGWGQSGFYSDDFSGNRAWFTKASVLGSKIVVQTGVSGVCMASAKGGSPFGNTTDISSAPVRVKVWKIDEFLPTS